MSDSKRKQIGDSVNHPANKRQQILDPKERVIVGYLGEEDKDHSPRLSLVLAILEKGNTENPHGSLLEQLKSGVDKLIIPPSVTKEQILEVAIDEIKHSLGDNFEPSRLI